MCEQRMLWTPIGLNDNWEQTAVKSVFVWRQHGNERIVSENIKLFLKGNFPSFTTLLLLDYYGYYLIIITFIISA